MDIDKKIFEWLKVLIGIIGAIIAALWTIFIFNYDLKIAERQAITNLDHAIAGLITNCMIIDLKNEFLSISDLIESEVKIEKACVSNFQEAFSLSRSSELHIKKPIFVNSENWEKLWESLRNEIKHSYTTQYREVVLLRYWEDIKSKI